MKRVRIALVGIVAASTLACATPSFLQTPAQRLCTRLVDTCDLKPSNGNDPYAACVEDLQPFVDDSPPDELAQLDQCVANATGCGEVQGCLAGAGLKRVLNDIGGLFRGIGEIFKSD